MTVAGERVGGAVETGGVIVVLVDGIVVVAELGSVVVVVELATIRVASA
jgi:hypothetical protein